MSIPFTGFNTAPTVYGHVQATSQQAPSLEKYDSVVIGGGLAGLSTAIELAEKGQKVLVLEAKKIGDGASGRNGGQLWPGFEGDLSSMQEEHGDNHANSAWALVNDGLRTVHSRLESHPTKCDFKPGVLLAAMDEDDNQWCKDEAKVFADAGFTFAKYVDAETIKDKLYNTTIFTGGLLYQGDDPKAQYGHLNPVKYVDHLAKMAQKLGVEIMQESPVTGVSGEKGNFAIDTKLGQARADTVVFATGAEFIRPEGVGYDLLPRHFIRAQTVILATEPMSRELASQIIPGTACFADTREVAMNYGRIVEANDGTDRVRLTFGGADALSQVQTAFAARTIENEMYNTFPLLKEHGIKVEQAWGGNCDLSPSALPKLSEVKPGMYQMSGFSGQGNVLTAVLGNAVAEQITTGASEKFELLASLTAEDRPFNRFETIAKLGVAAGMVKDGLVEKYEGFKEKLQARRASAPAA